MQISLHKSNTIVVRIFRNIPSQAPAYLVVWHLIHPPPPFPQHNTLQSLGTHKRIIATGNGQNDYR